MDDLVADVFGDSGNHYCSNPVFDRSLALAGRQEWARRRIADAGAVVLRGPDRRMLALAAVDQQRSWTEIQLSGVVPAEQGRGRYGHLLAAVEDACTNQTAGRVHAGASHRYPARLGPLRIRTGA